MGGEQKRPNIHIEDMTDLYIKSLQWPDEAIDGKIFNAGYENYRVREIAATIRNTTKKVTGNDIDIATMETNDPRSYHISSDKIKQELGFVPAHTLEEAIADLIEAFQNNKLIDPLNNILYYNVKMMKHINLK